MDYKKVHDISTDHQNHGRKNEAEDKGDKNGINYFILDIA
jgi:hypothetical protein